MTDTTSVPPTAPGPPPPAPPGVPTASERFFAWVEGLGIVRADGWLGGVCGGIAARLRIDPLIVRGIFVVVALLGFPALLVYAIAWALLPDSEGRIHMRELIRGQYDPAMTGVLILAIVGLVPVVPWLRNIAMWPLWALTGFAPWAWSDSGPSGLGVFGFLLALALIGGAVFLIVRSARADGSHRAGGRTASAPPAAPVHADPAAADPAAAPASASSAMPADAAADQSLLGPPAFEPADGVATDAQIADWRAQHAEWRVQQEAWRRSQQDAARAAREQARRERHAHGTAFALEAEERRRVRRATRPRTSFAFVLTVLGAAIVGGAIAVLIALGAADTAAGAGAIGVFTAAFISALGMVVAGIIRRRSGFLTAVALVLLVIGATTAAASGGGTVTLGDVSLGTASYEQRIVQPVGGTFLSVGPLSDTEDVTAGGVMLTKGVGGTEIVVDPQARLILDATLGDGVVEYTTVKTDSGDVVSSGTVSPDADGSVTWSAGGDSESADPLTTQHVTLDQRTGSVRVTIYQK